MIRQKDKSIYEEMRDWVWKHMDISDPDKCWNWKGKKNIKGYGRMIMFQREYAATRVVYEIVNGKIPSGYLICHKCDNPSCCNPNHLFAGLPKDNMEDMVQKNRNNWSTHAKLNESQVKEVRKLFSTGEYKEKELAIMFDVSKTIIARVVREETYKEVD